VFQFEAQKNVAATGSNLVWTSIGRRDSANLPQLVADATEWQAVKENGFAGVANAAGASAGPLRFADGTTDTNTVVRHIVAVVRCAPALRGRETLFCGEILYRTSGRPHNNPEGNAVAYLDTSRFCEVAWKIDGVEGAPLLAGMTHLLEIEFSRDVTLHTLGIGSDTGRREWLRGWGGAFHEFLGFSETPPMDARLAVNHYLNLKWKLGLDLPRASTGQVQSARELGAHFGPYFGSLLIVR